MPVAHYTIVMKKVIKIDECCEYRLANKKEIELYEEVLKKWVNMNTIEDIKNTYELKYMILFTECLFVFM